MSEPRETPGRPAPRQYRIFRNGAGGGTRINGYRLETGAGFDPVTLFDERGERVGILLGFPVDLAGERVIRGSFTAPFALGEDCDGFARRLMDALGGSLLLILDFAGRTLIYTDAAAQIPCVHDRRTSRAGATADALLSDAEYDGRFDGALYTHLDIRRDGWFPGGLTAHDGVERLLANHRLDLDDGAVSRYWPVAEWTASATPEDDAAEIVSLVRAQMNAWRAEGSRLAIGLTGGQETRILLACARPVSREADVLFVTVEGERPNAVDTVLAERLARDFGLHHRRLPRVVAGQAQQAAYLRRGGHCVGGANLVSHPSVAPLAPDHVFVGGAGGEAARAFFWHRGDTPESTVPGASLLGRFGLPAREGVAARLEEWWREIPCADTLKRLDLAYLEQRVAPWASAQFCCDPTLLRQNPLCATPVVTRMLALPERWKRENLLAEAILRACWPELGDYPYNSLGKIDDFLRKGRRALAHPHVVARKLRKLRARFTKNKAERT